MDGILPVQGGYGPAGIFNDPGADLYHGFAPSLVIDRRLEAAMQGGVPAQQAPVPPEVFAATRAPQISTTDFMRGPKPYTYAEYIPKLVGDTNAYYTTMNDLVSGANLDGLTHTPWPPEIYVSPEPNPKARGYYEPHTQRIVLQPLDAVPEYKRQGRPIDPNKDLSFTRESGVDVSGYVPVRTGIPFVGNQTLAHELGHFFTDGAAIYDGVDYNPMITALSMTAPESWRDPRGLRSGLTPDFNPREPLADQFAAALDLATQGRINPQQAPMERGRYNLQAIPHQDLADLYGNSAGLFGDAPSPDHNRTEWSALIEGERNYASRIPRQGVIADPQLRQDIMLGLLSDILRAPLGYQQIIPPPFMRPEKDTGEYKVRARTVPKQK
jgi:hypothetical protein